MCFLLYREVLCGELKVQAPGELKKEWREGTEVSESDRVARRGGLNGRKWPLPCTQRRISALLANAAVTGTTVMDKNSVLS